jgi:hypothetical protein
VVCRAYNTHIKRALGPDGDDEMTETAKFYIEGCAYDGFSRGKFFATVEDGIKAAKRQARQSVAKNEHQSNVWYYVVEAISGAHKTRASVEATRGEPECRVTFEG